MFLKKEKYFNNNILNSGFKYYLDTVSELSQLLDLHQSVKPPLDADIFPF